ncbi:hypothetical protein [Zhihengliuella sp.]|uniref:hypothetical protein n=1 Tax=Zhihengliuella sp. TaxID=1954483 RepID=UPI0028127E8E|nr:hypothetical protein [Zhihengliuella sp.]
MDTLDTTSVTHLHATGTPPGIRRRRVLTGAAWSVPIIAAAVSAPAASASPSTGGQLTYPASFRYNGAGLQVEQTFMTATADGLAAGVATGTITLTVTAPAGTTLQTLTLNAGWVLTNPDSTNGVFIFVHSEGVVTGRDGTHSFSLPTYTLRTPEEPPAPGSVTLSWTSDNFTGGSATYTG